jgi:hypothetical protein
LQQDSSNLFGSRAFIARFRIVGLRRPLCIVALKQSSAFEIE